MAKRKPDQWYLYQWNLSDNFLGLPKRKIQIEPLEPCLLYVAYLGGGPDWKEKNTPEKSILVLLLNASPFSQSDQNYYKFFDSYNVEELSQKFAVTVERLAGDRARWQLERNCLGMSDTEIDTWIGAVIQWHNQEVRRILNDRPAFFS